MIAEMIMNSTPQKKSFAGFQSVHSPIVQLWFINMHRRYASRNARIYLFGGKSTNSP